jgi:type VI secretion system secreted protein VgrG
MATLALPSLDQALRPVRLESPVEGLLVRAFHGWEELSVPYDYSLDLVTTGAAIDADALLRQDVAVVLATGAGVRRFTGRVRRFEYTGEQDGWHSYRASIVPWFWFLTLSSDCRIYQEQTARQIVADVVSRMGFSGQFADRCTGEYPVREFCVQYNESHFNFISRLLEEEGIFYWFEHDGTKQTLVLSDSNSQAPTLAQPSPIRVVSSDVKALDDDVITSLTTTVGVHTGQVRLADYDYLQPSLPLVGQIAGSEPEEVYEFPGHRTFLSPAEGTDWARVRLEEAASRREVVRGAGHVRGLESGRRVQLVEMDPNAGKEGEYLVTRVEHRCRTGNLRDGDEAFHYDNGFRLIPVATPYRPSRRAVKPIMRGAQTATVVGKAGEEIWTDPHGRVKVHFAWDRVGQRDEKSSCWVRVSSPWAGKGWGAVHIPRIGQEVIVDWLEGDPDHPIITGRVYNAEQGVPYDLPTNATQSGIKSRSSKGAGTANFNEIRMEDRKGEEQLYIHAEKNEDIVVENDKTEAVGHDETITIGNDRQETVGNDETLTVVNNRTRHVKANEMVTVNLMRMHNVGINEMINVGGAQQLSVGGFRMTNIGAYLMETVMGWMKTTVMQSQTVDVKKSATILAGDELLLDVGGGAATIHMKSDGSILIKGKNITVEDEGETNVRSTNNWVQRAAKILHN